MATTSIATILESFSNTVPITILDTNELSEETHNLVEHPLVLSCALYRLIKEEANVDVKPGIRFGYAAWGITSNAKDILVRVRQEDRELAEEIKRDFGQKLTYFTLVVGPLSKYKQDLHYFINNNFYINGSYSVPDKFIAMAYKLPYFYYYNKGQLDFFEDLIKTVNSGDSFSGEVAVTYLGKLTPNTRRTRGKIEYWFKDEKENRIVVELECNNPLLALIDHMSHMKLSLRGNYFKRSNYSVEYYMAKNWKFS